MTKKILYTSAEAAKYVENISGWVDIHGRFYGKDEKMARWSSCTHEICECGNEYTKGWTCCEECREKNRVERFNKLEKKAWDGKTPLCLDDGDEYFFDSDSLIDYLDENELCVDKLQLRLCKSISIPTLDQDYFTSELHEDAELPCEVIQAIDDLNKIIMKHGESASWEPDKYAAILDMPKPALNDQNKRG